jgi:serine/threonine-protein kinase
MRLDAWLRQQHSPAERLRLVERLAQALNTVHDRGEILAALSPDRVEIGGDMKVELGPAMRGQPEPGYSAPEVLEGGPPSTAADIYAAGALCWEILVGRPCGEAPRPLLEVVPDLPRELANSVMGCLEKSPDWRPKDLTYLAQLAAAQQKIGRAPAAADPPPTVSTPARGVPSPARIAPSPARNFAPPKRESRSQLPLILAALLLVAAAGASYYFWMRPATPAATPTVRATPTPTATVAPDLAVAATPTPAPVAMASATPPPVAIATVATPTPPPVRAVATPQPETTLAAAPVPVATPTPAPTPVAATQAAADPEPAAAAAVGPASLATVSPLSVKRGGRVLLDLRGAGLRSDQHVQILPIKDAPRGISVVRTKWASANLVTVLLELDANVTPTAYAIALESANGDRTNALHLTVTK